MHVSELSLRSMPRQSSGGWSTPKTIAEGEGWFEEVNWVVAREARIAT